MTARGRAERVRERVLAVCTDDAERVAADEALQDCDALRDLLSLQLDYSATRFERRGVGPIADRLGPLEPDQPTLEAVLGDSAQGIRNAVLSLAAFVLLAIGWVLTLDLLRFPVVGGLLAAGVREDQLARTMHWLRYGPIDVALAAFVATGVLLMIPAVRQQAHRMRVAAGLLASPAEVRAAFFERLRGAAFPRIGELFRTVGYRAMFAESAELVAYAPLLRSRLDGAERLAPFDRGPVPVRWGGYPGIALSSARWSWRQGWAVAGATAAGALAARFVPVASLWVAAAELALVVGVVVYLRGRGLRATRALALRRVDLAGTAVWSVLVFAAMRSAVVYAGPLVPPVWRVLAPASHIPITARVVLAAALTITATPLVEEVLWRSVFLGALLERLGPGWAVLLSAAVFSAVHVSPPAMLAAFVVGLGCGCLVVVTRSVWPAVLLHAAFNAAAILPRFFG